jgi:hypothetical protein
MELERFLLPSGFGLQDAGSHGPIEEVQDVSFVLVLELSEETGVNRRTHDRSLFQQTPYLGIEAGEPFPEEFLDRGRQSGEIFSLPPPRTSLVAEFLGIDEQLESLLQVLRIPLAAAVKFLCEEGIGPKGWKDGFHHLVHGLLGQRSYLQEGDPFSTKESGKILFMDRSSGHAFRGGAVRVGLLGAREQGKQTKGRFAAGLGCLEKPDGFRVEGLCVVHDEDDRLFPAEGFDQAQQKAGSGLPIKGFGAGE